MERIRVEMGGRGVEKEEGWDWEGVEREEGVGRGDWKREGRGMGRWVGKEDRKGGERGDIICWRRSYKVLDSLFLYTDTTSIKTRLLQRTSRL